MANKLTTFEQARQQVQSLKEYTDAMVSEVSEVTAESIQEIAEQLPTSTTVTLPVSGWSGNQQVIAVSEVTANNTIFVSAAEASKSVYNTANVSCTAQSAGKLTFTCGTIPTVNLTVNLVIVS